MKFSDYKYERPDLVKEGEKIEALIEEFKEAKDLVQAEDLFEKMNEIRRHISTMSALAYIRHSIDINNKFYDEEQTFLDENMPAYGESVTKFYRAITESKYRPDLEKKWGKQLFTMAELDLKSFSKEIIEDSVEENKLVGEYSKLMASAKIDFEGEKRTLSQIGPFMQSEDREMRKKANEAYNSFFIENEDEFDRIFDSLVKVRDRMAKKLGYKNFVELGYPRLGRSDYNSKDVENYRKQVEREIVPLVAELKERQKSRLGLEDLKYYDESLQFLSGNPMPQGDADWIVENGKKMYGELSKETDEFFNFMLDRGLMDLESKDGKMSGGYCHFLDDYQSPFIFANFNGTRGDVDVLTHEAGHAFQAYRSRKSGIPEYSFPTYEASEIHSMSMEFITWPWMELFFKDDLEKYKFVHLAGTITFIPYGVAVDEFQHFVYENPEVSPSERKAKWREIEKKYLPYKDYDGNDFLERGGFWFRQRHIFQSPFYYIDYTLAQVCAHQFFNKLEEDRDQAWEDYLRLCDQGGSKSFLELLEVARLENPFVDGTIKKTIEPIKGYLDNIDDSKF